MCNINDLKQPGNKDAMDEASETSRNITFLMSALRAVNS